MEHGTNAVGAGYAAGECAIKLGWAHYPHPTTMVGTAAHALPAAAAVKSQLAGTMAADALLLRPETARANANTTFLGGTTVEAIDRAAKTIRASPPGHQALRSSGARAGACRDPRCPAMSRVR